MGMVKLTTVKSNNDHIIMRREQNKQIRVATVCKFQGKRFIEEDSGKDRLVDEYLNRLEVENW